MTKYINDKIINIFEKSQNKNHIHDDEQIQTCAKGYDYICLKRDSNGKLINTDKVIKQANESQYIVKILTNNNHIHNYKVSGNQISDFLKRYINNEEEGQIIEIDKYYPDSLA